jgi:uncharacterized RDD family membrane protein YckC
MPKSFYASWGTRVGAYLIDFLIAGLVPTIIDLIGYVQFMSKLVNNVRACQEQGMTTCPTTVHMASGTTFLFFVAALLGLAGQLWLSHSEGTTGYTPGKKALGIKLVRESTGRPVGFGTAFGRRMLQIVDALPFYLGFLWPAWDAKRQTLSDKILSTIVINTPPRPAAH